MSSRRTARGLRRFVGSASSAFTCCCQPQGRERIPSMNEEEEFATVLPSRELEWDSTSHVFRLRSRDSYVPPVLPKESSVIPSIDDFRLLKTVGRGAFGKVVMSIHITTNTLCALKIVPKAKISTPKQTRQILQELQILKKIKSPFCVTLQYAFQNEFFLFYAFEFASGGMLFHHLSEAGKFSEAKSRFYFGEIILALEYLHGFEIVFRDLKPENCMLSAIGHIILTDFGSAKILTDGERSTTLAGTPQYMAPEVLRGEPYSFSADWWSSGILLFEMLVGKAPFNSIDRLELYRMVLRSEFRAPYFISSRARSLLYRLIERDPDLRLGCSEEDNHLHSAAEIKCHAFFSQLPIDPDEESRYAAEEAERERHFQALERRRANKMSTAAGGIVRSLSFRAGRRISTAFTVGSCVPCEWTWEELSQRNIPPPFTPMLRHPADCTYFDPVMTALPPTLSDLATTHRDLRLDGFKFSIHSSCQDDAAEP